MMRLAALPQIVQTGSHACNWTALVQQNHNGLQSSEVNHAVLSLLPMALVRSKTTCQDC